MAKSIESLNEKIAKMEGTLARHEKTKARKLAKLAKTIDENDIFWLNCDIEVLNDSIQSAICKLAALKEELAKAEVNEEKKAKKEAAIPEQLKEFRVKMVESWDAHDKAERDAVLEEGESWWKTGKGSYSDWHRYSTLSDEKIHEDNWKAATSIIDNLLRRVEKAVGRMKSFDHLYLHNGNWMEGLALNGWIEGENGKVEVRSIHAGGYNIQRLHVRVLTIKM